MKVSDTPLPGVLLIEPAVFEDSRGFFMETFHAERYAGAGVPGPFVQDNLSFSERGVLRGLHLQNPNPQGKLVYVLQGEVFDVAVDVRAGSPDFGRWAGEMLSSANKRQVYIPQGFAHGFCVVSETALIAYKCTGPYNAESELTVAWNDPQIGIEWPVDQPLLSAKDAAAPCLADMDPDLLPRYPGGAG